MKLYLVRHGRTTAHEKHVRQSPESNLGKLGLKQARKAAKRLRGEEIDIIFSSPWKRAAETAEIISKDLEKEVNFLEMIREREQTVTLNGISWDSDLHKVYEEKLHKNLQNLDWKYSKDEESFRQVIKRALEFKKFLEAKHQDQTVLAVSHGTFLRCFVALCILGENFETDYFVKVFESINFENTGLSILEFEDGVWRVRLLNEHKHAS